jgi:ubiquinone biosynthesis protein UbiJ
LSEESGLIAARRDVERFCLDVDALHEDFRRLENRLQRVESAGCPDC